MKYTTRRPAITDWILSDKKRMREALSRGTDTDQSDGVDTQTEVDRRAANDGGAEPKS